jgi:hypothetical protein
MDGQSQHALAAQHLLNHNSTAKTHLVTTVKETQLDRG